MAQYGLGLMYADGLGVEQNYAEALTWYRKAADQGCAAAQNNLGMMHRKGTEKQWEISAELIKAGATTRNKIAQQQLRWMHQNGLIVEQSYAEALTWYRKAADQGHAYAQNQLGWMYRFGMGVEQNYAEALIWYRRAADQGHAFAQNQLGFMHQKGMGVEQNDAEALTWYRKATDQGHAFAQN